MRSRWIERFTPLRTPRLRLLCFPYAGGSASQFKTWWPALPDIDVCAVQLPGRQRRIAETPCRQVGEVVGPLAAELERLLDVPLALFGDCTGAFLAFELCRSLRRTARRSPMHLFAACCRAPHLPRRHACLHTLDGDALKRGMSALDIVPAWLLNDAIAWQEFLPVLRADFEMAETYDYSDDGPLNAPITVFAGLNDPVCSIDEAEEWARQTTGSFRLRVLDGGHDLTRSHQDALLSSVRQACAAAAASPFTQEAR